jgi:signal transduction histidine kinase
MRFTGRLVLGAVGLLLFSTLVLVWTFRAALRDHLEDNLQAALEREARLIQDALPEDARAWDRLVGRLAAERGHRVTLLDSTGQPVADNLLAPAQLRTAPSMAGDSEVAAALLGEIGMARRVGQGSARLVIVVPGLPVVRMSSDLSEVEAAVGDTQRSLFLATLLALVAGGLVAWAGARSIAAPLTDLAEAAQALSAGEPLRLPRAKVPEVEAVAHALRELQHELADRSTAMTHGQAQAAALIEAMVEGVLATDDRGRVILANPAARRMLGYDPEARFDDLLPLFRSRSAREVIEAGMGGEVIQGREVEVGGRVALASSRPLPAGGLILVLHDLTELRRLETVRRDFVANASHELKTPLTSIAGYAETLLGDDPPPELRRKFLETILANALRMQALVDDQLDLARIESGRWQPVTAPVEVAAAIQEAWTPRQDTAEAAGVRFVVEVDPAVSTLTVDREALQQVLGNLFDNALRYTPRGGKIVARVEPAEGDVTIVVSDTGTGIGGEHLPRIFERYYRVDPARSREAGGTGLGLAIVKHLIEAHGGTVTAESEVGVGTTIRCRFPG